MLKAISHRTQAIVASYLFLNTLFSILMINSVHSALVQIHLNQEAVERLFNEQVNSIQSISHEIENLKKNYDSLKELLNKETSFKEALKFTLAFEGGLSDDEGDTGGLTNLGITHAEYDEYRKSKGLSPRSVAYISMEEATNIYKNTYWLNSGCGKTPRRIALSCFDWQVNSGRGITTLQRVLGVRVDGIAGPETFNELHSWLTKPQNEDKLLHNFFLDRINAYSRWGVGSQRKFLYGWLRRAETLKRYLNVP